MAILFSARRGAMPRARLFRRMLVAAACLALPLGSNFAYADEEGGCAYNRVIYPEGTEMCQGGQQVRCEDGAWGDIGLCDDAEPGPPPRTGGGDVEIR